MTITQFLIFATIACSAAADEAWKIDMSQVRPRTEAPGFWDHRLFKPKMMPQSSFDVKTDANGRIVGGWVVTPNEHPYQAALFLRMGNSVFLCGGSVIGEYAVLTAAHCPEDTDSTQIILGAHNINELENTQQRIMIERFSYRCHHLYNTWTLNNDICLLLLPTQIQFNSYVQPIALPRTEALRSNLFVDYWGTVSGWGRTTDSSWATSPVLRAVSNIVITNEECAAVYGNSIVVSTTICMRNFGQATCHGDSGGPLTTITADGDQVLIGVVSFGSARGCEVPQPDGYARVTEFVDWIEYYVNRHRPT